MFNGFGIERDGVMLTDSAGFHRIEESEIQHGNGSHESTVILRGDAGDLEVRNITVRYPGLAIASKRIEITNLSQADVTLTRIDSARASLPADSYTLRYFTGSHGNEFVPETVLLRGTKILEAVRGRSSLDIHPSFALTGEKTGAIVASIAWSGNWITRFEPLPTGAYQISMGLSTWEFSKTLRPGETMAAPEVVFVHLPGGTLDDAALEFGRLTRDFWCPTNDLKRAVALEWNAWQPYQDTAINEEIFKANVDICAELGIDVCTLDAGWFGTPESGWYAARGDWDVVNNEKFPSGIKGLSQYARSKGVRFGLWCEIEAVGYGSKLRHGRQDLLARRNGEELWYLCLGCPEAVDWAFAALSALVEEGDLAWLKIDFNLDPWAGCNRTDHGHDAGDGLHAHYLGLYELLDRFRDAYPDVIIEGCSGGGGRLDLGIMKRMHLAFLSDMDYSVNGLQIAWGAGAMLHPSAWIEFPWSQTLNPVGRNRDSSPIREDMPPHKFDYIIRVGMINHFSCSYRFPDWSQWFLDRLKYHLDRYKEDISGFVRDGDFHRLTDQVQRTGAGEHWAGFAFARPDGSAALLFVFRTEGGEDERAISLRGLDPDAAYTVDFEDRGESITRSGRELMEAGLTFTLPEEASEIVRLTRTA
jgi:alpha-galactosidase